MLSFRNHRKNAAPVKQGRSKNDSVTVRCTSSEVALTAANDLRAGLAEMTGRKVVIHEDSRLNAHQLAIDLGAVQGEPSTSGPSLTGDSFAVVRSNDQSLSLRAGSGPALIHAAAVLLERLGASF